MIETLPIVRPIHFFDIEVDCDYAPHTTTLLSTNYLLPQMGALLDQEDFGEVAMAWNEEGLFFQVNVSKSLEQVDYPEWKKGDSFEVMIDTRDIKTTSYNTRFCHHFIFLPEKVGDIHAFEKTHFRLEDSHPLCDPSLLDVRCKKGKGSYTLFIYIPQNCLHGYDPLQFKRLGLNYRLNRYRGDAQEFSTSSLDLNHVEQMPSTWASVCLTGKEK
ncbi:MAG: hypothetical protein K0S74_258 [Chlamydiales bacterium]|jgi:hypothetical protein|nr:hypothetical protein [Chlamydiales bacterium]